MKKFILLILIILLFNLSGALVTGEATEGDLSLSVSVSNPIPILEIISPKNGTYLVNQINLIFNYTNADIIYFNLDGATNISINETTTFFATTGNHTLILYAINENTTIKKSINFTVNPNLFKIIYDNYKNYSLTTNFNGITYEEYLSLPEITLENKYGKINFKKNINVPADKNTKDKTVNLDKYSYINQNEIHLDATELPNFNKSAILYLYNLPFKNPIILKDREICPNAECEHISYINSTLTFKVTRFSTYTAIEAPIEIIPPTIPSDGSGGKSFNKDNFQTSEEEIKITSKQGRIVEKEIEVINNLDRSNEITLIFNGMDEIISNKNYTIILDPNERKNIKIEFLIRNHLEPGVKLGELQIGNKIIPITIIIETAESLFDVTLELNKNKFYQHQKIKSRTTLTNLGETNILNAELIYEIKDLNNKIYFTEKEKIEIQNELMKTKEIKTKLPSGKYIIIATLNYENKTGISSSEFIISKINYCIWIIIIILLLLIVLIYYKSKISKSRGK